MQDSTQVYSKVINTMTSIFDELGKRFGATGAHLWQIMIRQVYIQAIQITVTGILLSIIGIVSIRLVRKAAKENRNWDDSGWIAVAVIGGMAALGGMVTLLVGINQLIQAIYNPEYQALKNIIQLVSSH